MTEEMKSLHKNQTCKLVKPYKRQKIIGCKWVFMKKEIISDVVSVKHKACLVAKGYCHTEVLTSTKYSLRLWSAPLSACYSHGYLVWSETRANLMWKWLFFMASLRGRSLCISQRDSLLKAKKITCAS